MNYEEGVGLGGMGKKSNMDAVNTSTSVACSSRKKEKFRVEQLAQLLTEAELRKMIIGSLKFRVEQLAQLLTEAEVEGDRSRAEKNDHRIGFCMVVLLGLLAVCSTFDLEASDRSAVIIEEIKLSE
jgi:hypothetical protein